MAQGLRRSTALILALALPLAAGLDSTPATAGVPVLGASLPASIPTPLSAPSWLELSPEQKQILAPLEKDWNGMEAIRRQKWVAIAKRYPTLTPEEQARLRERMAAWARLTPEERIKARERFKKLQKATPEQREALRLKWQEYQKLPPEEKKRLADLARAKAAAQKKPRPAKPSSKFVKPQAAAGASTAASATASAPASPTPPAPAEPAGAVPPPTAVAPR